MADYQTTSEKWTCEDCGETGWDIVPSHDCPIIECEECGSNSDQRIDGDDQFCQACIDQFEEEKQAQFSANLKAEK